MSRKYIFDIFDNCKVLDCFTLNEFPKMTKVPYGVYVLGEPSTIFDSNLLPCLQKNAIYIGKSGRGEGEYNYDCKHTKKNGERGFHKQSPLRNRLRRHRQNISSSKKDKTIYESKYGLFEEKYGLGEEIANAIPVSVVVPKTNIPNYEIKSWLVHVESSFIHSYTVKFGQSPFLNINESWDHSIKYKETGNSLSLGRAREIEEYSL